MVGKTMPPALVALWGCELLYQKLRMPMQELPSVLGTTKITQNNPCRLAWQFAAPAFKFYLFPVH